MTPAPRATLSGHLQLTDVAALTIYGSKPYSSVGYLGALLMELDSEPGADILASTDVVPDSSMGNDPGFVHAYGLVSGSLRGSGSLFDSATIFYNQDNPNASLTRASRGGDVDADGHEDLVLTGASDLGTTVFSIAQVSDDVGLLPVHEVASGIHLGGRTDELYTFAFPIIMSGAPLGDVTGDGVGDLGIIGLPNWGDYSMPLSPVGDAPAVVYVLGGPVTDGFVADDALATVRFNQDGSTSAISARVLGSDVDSDGVSDLVLGDHADGDRALYAGAFDVVYGPLNGAHDITAPEHRRTGEGQEDKLGGAIAAGDVDGDGYADVVSGAVEIAIHTRSGPGRIYLTSGPIHGVDRVDADATAMLIGNGAAGNAGVSYLGASAAVADIDQDGFDDIVAGAHWTGGVGATYIMYGPVSGTIDLALEDADATLWGPGSGVGGAGGVIDAGNDANGDGYPDIVIADPWDDTNGYDAGAVYLVFGGP